MSQFSAAAGTCMTMIPKTRESHSGTNHNIICIEETGTSGFKNELLYIQDEDISRLNLLGNLMKC